VMEKTLAAGCSVHRSPHHGQAVMCIMRFIITLTLPPLRASVAHCR